MGIVRGSMAMMLAVILILAAAGAITAAEVQSESEFSNLFGQLSVSASPGLTNMDSLVQALMATYKLPGVQACIIVGDTVVWTGAYGHMDADQTIPVTGSTLFLQASIAKTLLTTALLQCLENGQVDLDADVSAYLPFSVTNPHYPSTPITCRMILSHVSSIDRNDWSWIPDMVFGEDWSGNMSQYLHDYLVPGGPTYAESNYLTNEPGTFYIYSNYAFALLALVVENVTGIDFESYAQDSVLAPLGMNEASWLIGSLDANHIAMPLGYGDVYDVGNYPRSVSAADLDGDAVADLVTANHYSDDVAVLLNNGDGTFQEAVTYAADDGPSLVSCGDLDGDNDNELVVANSNSDNVSIILNNGDGTFQAAVHYPAGDYPWSVALSDLNKDNDIDLAVTNGASNTVSVLIGNGDGTFQTAVDYPTGTAPRSVYCCDLDGDNDIDLAVADRGASTISVLRNNGDGTFLPRVNYSAGTYPRIIVGGDFDGDGAIDLATANTGSNNVSVFLNNGDGTLASALSFGAGDSPQSILTSDINGDGALDLAVANSDSDDFTVLFGNGDGTFQSAVSYRAGDAPYSIACGDIDGDTDIDLITANSLSNDITVITNTGGGVLKQYSAYGHVSHPLWPIGTLRTSATQLAHHLATIPGYGEYNGVRVLDSLTVAQVMTNHYPLVFTTDEPRGLGWYSYMFTTGRVWGHEGGLPGCHTAMFVDPVQGNGVIVLANTDPNAGVVYITNALWDYSLDTDGDGILLADDNCPITYNPGQVDSDGDGIGDECEDGCCIGRVGDANGASGDEPTISDISVMIDAKFITGTCEGIIPCSAEADVNQSGESGPTCDDITISDISILIDYLFITGPSLGLAECL